MNILLTGGAGYVGSACLRHLKSQGHNVVAYDDLRKGHQQAVAGSPLVLGDIFNTQLLEKTIIDYEIEAIMHFAAATDVAESVSNPEYHYYNNLCGTLNLLNTMRKTGVKRLLFSSTCATYGDSQNKPMSEQTKLEPCSPYARSKLAVEWLIKDFSDTHEMGYTILRYFNAAGADVNGRHGEAHDPEYHLIPLVFQVALGKRKELLVYGKDYDTPDGTCIRDYTHTFDLATAHSLAIEYTNSKTQEVFNVGTGNGHSVLNVIRACCEVSGIKIPYKFTTRRPGDAPVLVANCDKISNFLGWSPNYQSIEAIVHTAWQWHKSNPDGYEK